jgi:hypothetical protein
VGAGLACALRIAPHRLWPRALAGLAAGALAGGAIALAGGRLMAGSLGELAERFPDSRLGFDRAGTLLGLADGNRLGIGVATALEGGLFVGCVVGALLIARRLRETAG